MGGSIAIVLARRRPDLTADADNPWASTLRVADPVALNRSAVGLCENPPDAFVRDMLLSSPVPRTYVYGSRTGLPDGATLLADAGVAIVEIDHAGHDMMTDNHSGVARALRSAFDL